MTNAAGTPETDMAARVGDGMPRRVPLTQRGLTEQQWAALQHEKANEPPRKPMCLQDSPGSLTTRQEEAGVNYNSIHAAFAAHGWVMFMSWFGMLMLRSHYFYKSHHMQA